MTGVTGPAATHARVVTPLLLALIHPPIVSGSARLGSIGRRRPAETVNRGGTSPAPPTLRPAATHAVRDTSLPAPVAIMTAAVWRQEQVTATTVLQANTTARVILIVRSVQWDRPLMSERLAAMRRVRPVKSSMRILHTKDGPAQKYGLQLTSEHHSRQKRNALLRRHLTQGVAISSCGVITVQLTGAAGAVTLLTMLVISPASIPIGISIRSRARNSAL